MEIGLILLAIILACFLGWLLRASFNATPWVAEPVEEAAYQAPFNAKPKLVALTTLLAVMTSFFGLVMSAYSLRMELGDWTPLDEPRLLWTNTAVLILASIVLQWTRNAAQQGILSRLKPGLVVTGGLTTLFLVGQYIAWMQLIDNGEGIKAGPANAFFYLMTGLHALHILGGMYVWARATLKVFGGDGRVEHSVSLCAIYWHFLLLVWLIFFGLMLAT